MKTITIPKRFGYPTLDITVNGETYKVKSGEEITIEDHVAEVIENALELEPKPKRYLTKIAQRVEGSIAELTLNDLEGIERISPHAFIYCDNLTIIEIPNSVTSIGEGAFNGNQSLESVRFEVNSKVESIGTTAFGRCKNLKSVYLPETPPVLEDSNFVNLNSNCVFYCKSQESLEAYKKAANWSTLTGTYTFVVESK